MNNVRTFVSIISASLFVIAGCSTSTVSVPVQSPTVDVVATADTDTVNVVDEAPPPPRTYRRVAATTHATKTAHGSLKGSLIPSNYVPSLMAAK
jgi:hypothetical protein